MSNFKHFRVTAALVSDACISRFRMLCYTQKERICRHGYQAMHQLFRSRYIPAQRCGMTCQTPSGSRATVRQVGQVRPVRKSREPCHDTSCQGFRELLPDRSDPALPFGSAAASLCQQSFGFILEDFFAGGLRKRALRRQCGILSGTVVAEFQSHLVRRDTGNLDGIFTVRIGQ